MSDLNNLLQIAADDKQSSYRRRQAVADLLKKHPAEEKTLSLRIYYFSNYRGLWSESFIYF